MAYTVAEFFATRKDQYHKKILGRITRSNPLRSMVPMSPFDLEEGRVPTVITQTHQLPTAYPTALTEVAAPSVVAGASDDTSSAACNPSATTIQTGHKERTFKLYSAAFKTPVFCLSDIKRKFQAVQFANFFERALANYTTVWWSDYYRIQNVAMSDNKVVTKASGALEWVSGDTNTNFTGVTTVPGSITEATWDHLKYIYWELVRLGVADELAVGTANGQPVIPVLASPHYIAKFTKDTADGVRTTVDYYDPKSNLKALGLREAINGIMFVPDLFPIRIGDIANVDGQGDGLDQVSEYTEANFIYPTINDTSITAGVGNKPNPAYKTAANGGSAELEVIQFLPKNVWEVNYEPVGPTSFGGMSFNPKTDYIGNFSFINQPTFDGANDRGNMAYYLSDIRVAAKPLYTDLGVSLLTKAID